MKHQKMTIGASVLLLLLVFAASAFAALNFVSENIPADGNPTQVAVSLANGLPIWYQDINGLKLAQCLDQEAHIDLGGGGLVLVDPCGIVGLLPQFPPSLANLDEVPYWQAEAAFNYESIQGGQVVPGGLALLAMALEGAGANAQPFTDGNQAVFSRIRLRIDVPVVGTYRVTHPFGTFDYVINNPGRRSINQTQDVGVEAVQDFLAAMRDRGIDFTVPDNFNPADDVAGAVVNSNGATIGPFLVAIPPFGNDLMGGPVTATNGNRYIGLPFAPDLALIYQPVTAGLSGVDYFRIELISEPPEGFFLNAAGNDGFGNDGLGSQVLEISDFQVIGKIFNDGDNTPPTAPPVTVGVLKGRTSADIDVFAGLDINSFDPVSEDLIDGTNVHGIDPQAIALAHPTNGVFRNAVTNMPLLSQTETLPSGASVRRINQLATGKSLFRYTVPQFGIGDSFHYVVQDTGGQISAPAEVIVIIEDLQIDRADFRIRTGTWHISGKADNTANSVTLRAGPQAVLASGEMKGKVAIIADSSDINLANNTGLMDYHVRIDNIPAGTTVSAINLHVVGPGNPVMFRLCGNPFISPFPVPCTVTNGTLDIKWDLLDSDRFIGASAAGIVNFVNAVDAVLQGDTYISVVTSGGTFGGPISGSVISPHIAETTVNDDGTWSFRGKTGFLPGVLPNVTARSNYGTQTFGKAVRLR